MSRRPQGLGLIIPAQTEVQSYKVDDDGKFVHGSMNINEHGMYIEGSSRVAAAASRRPANDECMELSYDEAEDMKRLHREGDVSLQDLELHEKLGEGNSSVVHRAYDRRHHQWLAVKRINIYDKGRRHQIIKELATLYKCDCPALLSFRGAFFKDGAISIALELMDIGSLSDILETITSIEEAELLYISKQLLEGLIYLRKRHKVHRDIKPSNICLNSKGEAKFSDFGITMELDNSMQACESFVGTSAYMSPERLMGARYSYPSDIWAFGVCLIESALGAFPFPMSGGYVEWVQSVVSGPSPTLPRASDGSYGKFSREFANFLVCCLNKDPEQRSTAEELMMHPWISISKTKPHLHRTPAQMQQWLAAVSDKMRQKRAPKVSRDNSDDMDTAYDPFERGYNQTHTNTTQSSGTQHPASSSNMKDSFYTVKPLS